MKTQCQHPYKEYNQCHLPYNRIQLKCSSHNGCGKVLREGYVFRKSDYPDYTHLSFGQRIVWDDDGSITDL